MKKIILMLALFLGAGFAVQSQNLFRVTLNNDLCVRNIVVKFNDGQVEDVAVGCSSIDMEIDNKTVESVNINGAECFPGRAQTIFTDNGSPAVAALAGTPRYIVKSDGVVYDLVIRKKDAGPQGN